MPGFRFAPRALLALGKELISTDEVAIYELIKNGIDAGSDNVETEARIVVTESDFLPVLEDVPVKKDLASLLEGLVAKVIPGTSLEIRDAGEGMSVKEAERRLSDGRNEVPSCGEPPRSIWWSCAPKVASRFWFEGRKKFDVEAASIGL